ncbi:polyprenol monophosphomannose synthase [Candidatus Aminicenantes bacterium AC-335-A11]|jgi:dolichol-phosphate mannosyltransferase|nr:polyprenol monophosphomannose synthase [SCandidatus Aminicenantes bacterium Aminicenantia_JdfR_composite]MCP2597349.1 polyprenol monophosphomannose synthase [Candidatus Aminicenantes bacterium AC-335-G13]MCP2598111.1 polyprenol monophosphomannose synthase [Candidatus Aminicenantes bacterium AC-335-L06]MCP2618036.1 polyprenol monophosphomannose synthase [Candidatus Aminicenantes bacterium AC-335-A11]
MDSKKEKVVVMIPTYNERENIKELIDEILNLKLDDFDIEIIVADDNSPDGTHEIVREISQQDNRVHLLVRKKRRGRGAGGIDGFKEALKSNPDYIIEMDGDFSHQPKYIPLLVKFCKDYDIVIGSRFVKGGKDLNRSLIRRFITFLVRNFIRRLFKVPVKDVSSGYRCFKREVLEKIDLDDLISVGPSIVLEILYKAYLMNFSFYEVPIVFIDRRKGKTKLNFLTLLETLIMALKFKKYIPSRIEAFKSSN